MRRFASSLILLGVLWGLGLIVFIVRLPEPLPRSAISGDAVIVFTGGGGARISAGMSLFAQGVGERMLISGVHQSTSRSRIEQLWAGDADRFSCCVDLGRLAKSTQGNAAEAEQWLGEQQFNSFVLVTSEYHMPRALLASKTRMSAAKITPYPVASSLLDDRGAPISRKAWVAICGEYTKYLVEQAKTFFLLLKSQVSP